MATRLSDLDGASLDELKALVLGLCERVAALEQENAALREEIARLKGLKGRPQLRPSGMAAEAESRQEKKAPRGKRGRGAKNARLCIDEAVVLAAAAPPGSRFKGYQDYVVQDLVLRPRTVRYRRERWLTPDGRTVIAPLPAWVRGHFGPELRRFVLAQYHRGQMTLPRLTRQLRDLGIDISKRQVQRLLTDGHEPFLAEAQAVLRSGLATARWVSVDDTGARHKSLPSGLTRWAAGAICTQIGNDHFAWFATTGTKSRLNFLELLQAGPPAYRINAAALDYMRQRGLAPCRIAALRRALVDQGGGPMDGQDAMRFGDAAAWTAFAAGFGIVATSGNAMDPLRIATEGALWGHIAAGGLLADTVILSDDAGQFKLGRHALCWVHAERLIHKLDTFNEQQRRAVAGIRRRIWWLYADLKGYCRDPSPTRKAELRRRFDRVFRTRTGFATLDRLLQRLYANKADLLMALERPEIPLHTNGSENDIRCQVTRRKISGGTRSDRGRDCRDAFLSLMKTCDKLGVSFWHYLADRLGLTYTARVLPLPQLIQQAATSR